jgi:cysteinyl-tRNA synthetase
MMSRMSKTFTSTKQWLCHHLQYPIHRSLSSDSTLSLQYSNLHLYNSLTQSIEQVPFSLTRQGLVSPKSESSNSSEAYGDGNRNVGLAFYTCGITSDTPPHLGHARTYVWVDILRRVLEQEHEYSVQRLFHHTLSTSSTTSPPTPLPPPPLFVMSVTDMDDEILAAAKDEGSSYGSVAKTDERPFCEDMDSLNCLRPHIVTRVSDYVESVIIPYIHRMCNSNVVYSVPDEGLYIDVMAFEHLMHPISKCGSLMPNISMATAPVTESTRTTAGINGLATIKATDASRDAVQTNNNCLASYPAKKDTRDFALWKFKNKSEEKSWESPWGDGRPGWYIDYSAMIEAISQQVQSSHQFYFHAGGIDLGFPHHTNEIAYHYQHQMTENTPVDSHCQHLYLQTNKWIPHWVRIGRLLIDGHKMSKSLKNCITIQELLTKKHDSFPNLASPADDFRLWCLGLSGSYRNATAFTWERLSEARDARKRIVHLLVNGEKWLQEYQADGPEVWDEKDHAVLDRSYGSWHRGYAALLDDLNGSHYVDIMMQLCDAGTSYLTD